MIVCNKCNVEKPIDQYFVETKKDTGKQYRKKYCNDCFRQQARDWKSKNRISKTKLKQIEEERIKNQKVCKSCNIPKDPNEYYAYRKSICKECIKTFEKKKYYDAETVKRENGGILRCPPKPGVYLDDYQRYYTKQILLAIGWSHNEEKDIFYKPGLKDKDGNWEIQFDSSYRGDIKKQYLKIRKEMTADKLPHLKIYRNSGAKYSQETINKIMYDYFINKQPLKDLEVKYNISQNTILYFSQRIYKLFLENV